LNIDDNDDDNGIMLDVGSPGLLVELKMAVVGIGSARLLVELIITFVEVGAPRLLVVLITIGGSVIDVPGSDMAAQTMSHFRRQ
jgi:hypothetical protein